IFIASIILCFSGDYMKNVSGLKTLRFLPPGGGSGSGGGSPTTVCDLTSVVSSSVPCNQLGDYALFDSTRSSSGISYSP
ncbi:MAG: hypothetical protein ACK56F_13305, partial [bacterium]